MYITVMLGIIFIEGRHPQAKPLRNIDVTMSWQAQHKSLNDVKAKMVASARQIGANAIIDFQYGQKSSFWHSGDGQWYGKGIASKLPEQVYQQIVSEYQLR
ncbi:MAG: hypothetical protein IT324_21590 [Anaerolineae bacterium]|nr:hypothetical protein [Anaerolineae bacterium]